MSDKIKLTIGHCFWEDHEGRALVEYSGEPAEYTIKKTKTHYTLLLAIDDVIDLISDANHYQEAWKDMGQEFFGLGMSARATKKTVIKQVEEQGFKIVTTYTKVGGMPTTTITKEAQ